MNWAPILIGITIICYTFAAYVFLAQVMNIYRWITDWNYRSEDNFFIVLQSLCITIVLVIIGSVPLCYI